MLPATALKLVVAEPAGTVIVDIETGSRALSLDSETTVPPARLGEFSVTVQLVLPDVPKLVGLQDKEVSVGAEGAGPVTVDAGPVTVDAGPVTVDAGPVTVPPVARVANDWPEFDAAATFPIAIDVLVTPAASVRFTIATVPFWTALLFMPHAKQVYVPKPAVQLSVLEALVADGPAVAEIDTTLPAGYVNVH
jgi:hypothetical protein